MLCGGHSRVRARHDHAGSALQQRLQHRSKGKHFVNDIGMELTPVQCFVSNVDMVGSVGDP